MTQVLIDRTTLEQLVAALKTGLWNTRALAGWAPSEIDRDYNDDNDKINAALTAGRAALANAEPAGWQTLVDHGKEAHELAKIMKDFADKNPESLMLKELK